jgi:hypothetical protein
VRQAEVGAKTMLDRTAEQFEITPFRLAADAGYGSAEMLGWLVDGRGIEPHVKVFDKSECTDGTFSRSDFAYDRSVRAAQTQSVEPRDEFLLAATAQNLRKLTKLIPVPAPIFAA